MSSLVLMVSDYLAGIRTLRKTVTGMNREQLLARPVPGTWSTLEVVCHLSDWDLIYADHMKRILAEDRPTLWDAEPDRFVMPLSYQERDVDEELAVVEATRRQMARILRTIPEDALQRVGLYSKHGERTLGQLLSLITDHIPHHVPFIQKKQRTLGLCV